MAVRRGYRRVLADRCVNVEEVSGTPDRDPQVRDIGNVMIRPRSHHFCCNL